MVFRVGIMFFLEMQYGMRKAFSSRRNNLYMFIIISCAYFTLYLFVFAVALVGLLVYSVSLWMAISCAPLWIVRWLFAIEYRNIFMAAHWHTICVQKSCCSAFFPNKIVFPNLRLAHHQFCCKHSLTEQNDSSIFFCNA